MKNIFCLFSLITICPILGMDDQIQFNPNDRMIISLCEAFMDGTLKAADDHLIFEDFEADREEKLYGHGSYSLPIHVAQQEIYKCLQSETQKAPAGLDIRIPGSAHPLDYDSSLSVKLRDWPSARLTDQELKSRQMTRFAAFLCGFDLEFEKEELQDNGIMCKEERETKKKLLDLELRAVKVNRELYKAALASKNEAAINAERVKKLHMAGFSTLINDIKKVREQCKMMHENPLTHDCGQQ